MAEELKRQKKGMQWYKGELLEMSSDLGDRLLPAFNTSTGIPFPKVSTQGSHSHGKAWGESCHGKAWKSHGK